MLRSTLLIPLAATLFWSPPIKAMTPTEGARFICPRLATYSRLTGLSTRPGTQSARDIARESGISDRTYAGGWRYARSRTDIPACRGVW